MALLSPEVYLKKQIAAVQEYSILAGAAISDIFSRPHYWADIFTQMDSIGVGSMPIVVLTGFFTGCVLALQSVVALQEFGAVSKTGSLVSLSTVKSSARCSPASWSPAATPPAWPPSSAP